jgi:phosphoglucosamine mutase
VVEAMRGGGFNLGGEQSGHLVFIDHSTTGDGMVAALQVLTIMRRTGSPISRLARVMTAVPQLMQSIKVARREPLEKLVGLAKIIRQIELELRDRGRVLVRYSGTEPKIRVMVECEDEASARDYVQRIGEAAIAELGAA